MEIDGIRITYFRSVYLGKLALNSEWIRVRDSSVSRTINAKSKAKMPEPVYGWMMGNGLATLEDDRLVITERGKEILEKFRTAWYSGS